MTSQPAHPAVRPRRLFVSGGSCLTKPAEELWVALGRELATEPGLVVITGGLRERRDKASNTADWAVIRGMKQALSGDVGELELRCETVLPDEQNDSSKLVRFRDGKVVTLRNRTSQSRRFSMTNSADVIVSVEGEFGTQGILDMALAIEKPILPLPFGQGASPKRWAQHRSAILEWFDMSEADAAKLEQVDLEHVSRAEIARLARQIKNHLMNGFMRNCFVMMPFDDPISNRVYDEAIRPALAMHGLRAVRTDRLGLTGDAVDCIRRALASCFIAIADTTNDRANVMYELGMAHADHKPVVLLRNSGAPDATPLPFDLHTEQCIMYDEDLQSLRRVLSRQLGVLTGKYASLDDDADRP